MFSVDLRLDMYLLWRNMAETTSVVRTSLMRRDSIETVIMVLERLAIYGRRSFPSYIFGDLN